MRIPFGKFRGVEIEDLPDDYLGWLRGLGDLRGPLRSAVEAEWSFRCGTDASAEAGTMSADVKRMAEDLVSAGYRALAKFHHPDRGGDTKAMVLVNASAEALRRWVRGA